MNLSLSLLNVNQLEILKRVAQGATRMEIAQEREVSAKTIEYHCMKIMKRLGIHDVARLTHWAIAAKVVGLMDFSVPVREQKVVKPLSIPKNVPAQELVVSVPSVTTISFKPAGCVTKVKKHSHSTPRYKMNRPAPTGKDGYLRALSGKIDVDDDKWCEFNPHAIEFETKI